MSVIPRSLACGLILSLALTALAETSSWAEGISVITVAPRVGEGGDSPVLSRAPTWGGGMTLISVGPRVGVSGQSPFGKNQKYDFQQYDAAAVFRLPWGWLHRSGDWGLETRLLASAGQLSAAGETSLMATLVPGLAVSSRNGRVSIDAGAGAGYFSNYKFGVQDFGGPVQIIGTAGIGFNLFTGFHAGYRFQHFSDAGIYGPGTIGVDMHIIDLSYRF